MLRTLRFFCFLAFCCLLVQSIQATPIPLAPPVVTFQEQGTVTTQADYFGNDPNAFGTTANAGANLITNALGYTFITFWNGNDQLVLGRRPIGGGTWVFITFTDAVLPNNPRDSHKTPHVAISPNDKRIHLCYGNNASTNDGLRYRISDGNPSADCSNAQFTKANLFPSPAGDERNWLVSGTPITYTGYPSFITTETSQKLALEYRQWEGGDTKKSSQYFATYNDNGTWSSSRMVIRGGNPAGLYQDPTGQFADSYARKSYIASDGGLAAHGNNIHFVWAYRETVNYELGNAYQHDFMYAKSDGSNNFATWKNTGGSTVSLPIIVTSSGVRAQELNYHWTTGPRSPAIAMDGDGNAHVAMIHTENGAGTSLRVWHYRRIGTSWSRFMPPTSLPVHEVNKAIHIDRTQNTVYYVTSYAGKIRIWAAQKWHENWEEGQALWDVWTERYNASSPGYTVLSDSALSSDGTTLWVPGQQTTTDPSATATPLDLNKFTLSNYRDFVTGQTLGTLMDGWYGFVGMKITIGAQPIKVTHLGRWVVSGNTGTHTVKVVRVSDGVDLGSVSVNTSGATAGEFKYAALASPLTLSANTSYYVVSEEPYGGDQCYASDTVLTHTGVATVNTGVFQWGSGYSEYGGTDHCYGPVSFKY